MSKDEAYDVCYAFVKMFPGMIRYSGEVLCGLDFFERICGDRDLRKEIIPVRTLRATAAAPSPALVPCVG